MMSRKVDYAQAAQPQDVCQVRLWRTCNRCGAAIAPNAYGNVTASAIVAHKTACDAAWDWKTDKPIASEMQS